MNDSYNYDFKFKVIFCVGIVFGFCGSKFIDSWNKTDSLQVVSVYDGDTFTADIKTWPDIVGDNIGIRIRGIDTPELRDERPIIQELALKAKRFSEQKLLSAQKVTISNLSRDKYFRIDADVFVDGVSLGQLLLQANLAKPYDGKHKQSWGDRSL